MDKFAALTAFVHVVESGSFAAAARDTSLSRSQVNRHVINLEDELGVQLLNRTTRSVSLTPAGDSFYKRSKAILSDLKDAEQQLQSDQVEPQGEIRINAPLSFGVRHLGPAMIDFLNRYPKISVQLALNDHFIDPVADGFDVTIRISEKKENPAFIEHEILEAKRVLCASPEYITRYGKPKHPRDLTDLPCLHYGNLPTGNYWRLNRDDDTVDVRVYGKLCSNNADVLCEAAVAGFGIALLPLFIAKEEIHAGKLLPVLQDYRAPTIYLTVLYAPNRHLSTRIRLFIKFIQAWLEETAI